MMRTLFYILLFTLPFFVRAQNNAVKGSGVIYTNGAPTLDIDPRFHAELAIDTASGLWWEYSRDLGWLKAGFRIQDVSGCTPPAYTPQDKQSEIARNACDSLYGWRAGAWRHLNPVKTYTAGTGINITGTTISNTGDLSSTNEIQTLSASGAGPTQYNIDLSLSGGSVTLKEGTNVNLTRSGNEITLNASDQYTGTVTSIDMTVPTAELDVSGVPITGSGTIALSWDNQLRNLIFASPTGGTGQPSFRALNYLDFNAALKDSLDIIVIRNVSEFATYPKNSSNRHKVLFWDDADRGGVFVLRNTGSANGGTIFQGNGASSKWHRITPDGRINVRWFGATGNGSTDDLTAMQAAANYTANNNGHLYFPVGTYITSGTVTVDSFSRITISGDGPALTILKRKNNTVGTVNRVLRIDGDGGDRVTVMNIGFDGNAQNQTVPSPVTQWQQYHNLYLLSNGSQAFSTITLQNINSYNPLGDGISLAGSPSDGFGLANIVNVYEEGRLYTRSSIIVTANFDGVNITNFTGPVVEVEPNGYSGSYRYNLNLTNIHCNSELDLNLLGARAAGRRGTCNANGLYLKGSLVSLGEFDFNISNFRFETKTALRMAYGSYRLVNGVIYADSAFTDTALLTEASANPTDTAVFQAVQFSRHSSVTGLTAYFVDDNAAGAKTLVSFQSCQFNGGTRSAAIRAGRFEFFNCTHTLTDTTTACIYTNGSTTKSGVSSYVVIQNNYLPDYAYLFRPSISGTGQRFLVEGGNARDGHRILWDRFDKIDVEALPQNLQRYDENTTTALNASHFPVQGRWRKGDRLYYRDPAAKGAEWAECTVSGRADGVSATGATSGATFKKSGLHAVNTTGATAGQVLKWNGSLWVPANDSIGGGSTNYQTWYDDGVAATQRANANFVSNSDIAFTLTDDGVNIETEVTADIPAAAVDFSEIQNVSTGTLAGRSTAGSGSLEQITVSTGLTISGGNLTAVDASTSNELQTYSHSGTTSYTNTLSNGGGSFTINAGGINTISHTAGTLTITATEVDGSITNEGQLGVGAGGASSSTLISNTSGSNPVTINVAGINTISETTSSNGGQITITATEVDGSTTNELQTYSHAGTTTYTNTLSNGGGSWSITGAGIAVISQTAGAVTVTATEVDGSLTNEGQLGVGAGGASSSVLTSNTSGATGVTINAAGILSISETTSANGGSITLTATEVDGSTSNELQTYSHSGTTSYTNTLSNGGGSFTINAGGINTISHTAGTLTITATEVDGSTTNELQTYSHAGTTTYTNTLSNGGGSWSITGAGIATISQTGGAITVTATEVDGSTTNEGQLGVGAGGASSSVLTSNTSGATGVTINVAGINTISETTSANGGQITITATEVDGSTTNELQTINNTSNATSHTVTLSNSGGSIQLVEGTNITLTTTGTASDAVVTIAASGGGGIYGDGTAGSGDDNLPPGGSTVTTNNDPLQFQTATAAGLISNVIQVLVPYSNDDAFTNYLAGYTPIDSFKIFNFDGGTYARTYSGDFNIESDDQILLTADSVRVSTVASSAKVPALVGINAQGTLKQITASTNDHVLKWSNGGWVTGAVPGGGGGVTGTGTANYVAYWTGASTIAADADFQFDGTRVGIQGAPVSGFSLYTANAVRFDGTAVIRGSGDNFTGSTATPHVRLWNTTASTGDTWYIGSENDGELSITSSNLGGIQAKFTANGDYQLTNALEMKVDAAPPSAPADGLSLYVGERANVQIPIWVDESGQAWETMASFFGSKWAMWSANGNGTGVSTWTLANSVSGTATTRNVASTSLFTSMRRIGYVTAASGSSVAGTRHSNQQFWRGNAAGLGGFIACFRFGFSTANTGNKQAFIGLRASSAAISGNTNPSSLTNIIGFGIDATQTTLRWMVNDGSGTATATNLGANFPSNTTDADMYDARIFATPNGGTVYYWIKNLSTGNITSGSSSSDLPSTTTFLCPVLWIGNGADATAVGIDVVQYGILTLN